MKIKEKLSIGTVAATAILILSACSTVQSGLEAWEGHSLDDLIESWGEPDRRVELGVGYYAYTWNAENSACQRTFTVRENTVVGFSDSDCE